MSRFVLIVLLGCTGHRDDQHARCVRAAEHSIAALEASVGQKSPYLGPRMRDVIALRCTADRWPASVIACYARATTGDAMNECRRELPPIQEDVYERDMLDIMSGGSNGFGARMRAP